MLATAAWSFAYALELSATGTSDREFWRALKYVGVTAGEHDHRLDRQRTKEPGARVFRYARCS